MNLLKPSLTIRTGLFAAFPLLGNAALITAIPGPDDQGGMIMPMVSIIDADDVMNPSSGRLSVAFNPQAVPVLRSLEEWSPGSWFAEAAAWRPDLGSPAGVGGTPAANAGNGDVFNNQYGFMFMSMPGMGMANIPVGQSLGLQLVSLSSPDLRSFNYVNSANLWDEVFAGAGSQVLWNGSMWHNYFTLPGDTPAGTYTATFEVFIADQEFSPGTGFVDYSSAALAAARDGNFESAFIHYDFTVIPEPSTVAVFAGLLMLLLALGRKRVESNGHP